MTPEARQTFALLRAPGQPTRIRCGVCGYLSDNVSDVANHYCPRCRTYHDLLSMKRRFERERHAQFARLWGEGGFDARAPR